MSCIFGQGGRGRSTALVADIQGLNYGSQHRIGAAQICERDEYDSVRELAADQVTDFQGEPGLAGSTGSGQRDKVDIRPIEQCTNRFDFRGSSDQRGQRLRHSEQRLARGSSAHGRGSTVFRIGTRIWPLRRSCRSHQAPSNGAPRRTHTVESERYSEQPFIRHAAVTICDEPPRPGSPGRPMLPGVQMATGDRLTPGRGPDQRTLAQTSRRAAGWAKDGTRRLPCRATFQWGLASHYSQFTTDHRSGPGEPRGVLKTIGGLHAHRSAV